VGTFERLGNDIRHPLLGRPGFVVFELLGE